MSREDPGAGRPASPVTAAGIDHVRLSYHYLDIGDIDAYGSLLAEHAQMYRPDGPSGHSRAEILELLASTTDPPCEHRIHKIIASGDAIAVTGRRTPLPTTDRADSDTDTAGVDFADIFTLTNEALLLTLRRYYQSRRSPTPTESHTEETA